MPVIPEQTRRYDETTQGLDELRVLVAQAYNNHDAHSLHEAQARLDAAQDRIFERTMEKTLR